MPALPYGSEGWGFEYLRPHTCKNAPEQALRHQGPSWFLDRSGFLLTPLLTGWPPVAPLLADGVSEDTGCRGFRRWDYVGTERDG